MKKRVGIILYNDLSVDARVLNELKILGTKYDLRILCTGEKPAKPQAVENYEVDYVQVDTVYQRFMMVSSTTNDLFLNFWSKKIKDFRHKHSLDLLHVHDLYLLPPALEAVKAKKIPVVVDLHENYPAAFRTYSWTKKLPHKLFVNHNYWDRVERDMLKETDGIVVLSSVFRKKLLTKDKWLEKDRFAVYPNVPDLDFYKGQKVSNENEDSIFRLFYLGVIGYSRGLHIASEAVKILRSKNFKVELHVAGKVHKNDQTYFEKDVLNEHVIHIPWIHLEHLGEHLSKMDVGISPIFKNPQHESGIANKVYQYMLFSKPILVSDCEPQEKLTKNEHCGLVHKDQDPEDFASKVEWLIKNPKEREEMGRLGRRAILNKYNTKVMGERLISLYERILKN
jgi:glycosyltransferase involved in cell wall biosynthesis